MLCFHLRRHKSLVSRLPEGGGNGSGSQNDPSGEVDDEKQEALLAQLEEAFSSDQAGRGDRAKVLETIQVCCLLRACDELVHFAASFRAVRTGDSWRVGW